MTTSQPQVNKDHYSFEKYSTPARFASYFYQLKEVLELNPATVLEVGVGDKVFGSFLKHNTNISYTSVDIAEDLHPDIVGDVLALPFEDNAFDVVCIFEVLEHLPFEKFALALKELTRVAQKGIIISLPHFGPPVRFLLKIPLFPEIKFAFKIPVLKKHLFNGQHYFEIGKKNFELKKIVDILKQFGFLSKEYVPFENQYHHFFVLKK